MEKDTKTFALETYLSNLYEKEIRLISPEDINFTFQPESNDNFWQQHDIPKEAYLQLVKTLPTLYKMITNHHNLADFFHEAEKAGLYDESVTWFDRRYMLSGNYINNVLWCQDGRHRMMAAKELQIPLPVVISERIFVNS